MTSSRDAMAVLHDPIAADAVRSKLADGHSQISRDATVPQCKLVAIAVVRSFIICAIFLGSAFQANQAHTLSFHEVVEDLSPPLLLDLCASGGAVLKSAGTDPWGYISLIRPSFRKVLTFVPVGPGAEELNLPTLRYYQSEEYLAGGPQHTIGFSAGMFKLNELRMNVTVAPPPVRSGRSSLDCLGDIAEDAGVVEHIGANFFGKAVAAALHAAGRPPPRVEVLEGPILARGALLLWEDRNQTMWSVTEAVFDGHYRASVGWKVYSTLAVVIWLLTTVMVVLGYSRFFYVEWSKSVDTWVVQYDFLWEQPQVRESSDTDFYRKAKTCSTFFVLDHVVGHVHMNEELWKTAFASSVIQAGLLSSLAILPTLHAAYFEEWKPLVQPLVFTHLFVAMAYGICYYWNSRVVGFLFLSPHYVLSSVLAVYSVAYFVCIFVFALTRTIAAPDEAAVYSAPAVTATLYSVILSRQLVAIRDHYTKVWEGTQSKGTITAFLARLNLDLRGIILTIAYGVFVILLVALLLALANTLYTTTTDGIGGFVMSGALPFMSLYFMIRVLLDRKNNCQNMTGQLIQDASFGFFSIF